MNRIKIAGICPKRNPSGIDRILRLLLCFFVPLCFVLFQCASNPEGPEDSEDPILVELRPITAAQAAGLAAYLRTLQTRAAGDTAESMAWAMINTCCEERAMVMQYITASSAFPLPAGIPVMDAEQLTDDAIQALAANPGIDIASINITGPLIAEVQYIDPNGIPIGGDPFPIHWPYHKGAVVNVEGEFRVIDLSVGNEPLSIDEWAHCFVTEDVQCHHLSDSDYDEARIYWNSVMSGLEIPDRPEKICGYTLTPIFRFRRDQDPQYDQLRWCPSSMETQSDGFASLMKLLYGVDVDKSKIAQYTCIYTALPETELESIR